MDMNSILSTFGICNKPAHILIFFSSLLNIFSRSIWLGALKLMFVQSAYIPRKLSFKQFGRSIM